MGWVIDLDGVMWLAEEPIAGSADAVAHLRAAGVDVVFVTNNSFEPVEVVEAKLWRIGVDAGGAVLTSAMAAGSLVEPDERVLVCAGDGVARAVWARGAEVVSDDPGSGRPDVVIVGLTQRFDYSMLTVAARAVRDGARLIGTNSDPTYPTPSGLLPGGGSLLAAVAAASGSDPVLAGKPHPAMVELVRARLDAVEVVVGDREDTDGSFASALGARFAWVGSGVTDPDAAPADAAMTAPDLAAVVRRLL